MQTIHDFATKRERMQMERKLFKKYGGKIPTVRHHPKLLVEMKVKSDRSNDTQT